MRKPSAQLPLVLCSSLCSVIVVFKTRPGDRMFPARIRTIRLSPQLSLLRQGGSKANFGNLIVIPLNNSLLYVAPLYIESSNATLPQLQKVVVAFGSRVAMDVRFDDVTT